MSTPEHRRLTLWLGAVLAAAFVSGACDDDDDTGPDTGSIEVTTATTGTDIDADGFTVSIDGGAAQPIGVNATETYSSIATGTRTVTLAGVATNCGVTGLNPVILTLDPGETDQVTFPAVCETVIAGLTGTMAFESDRTGDFEVFKMAADGSTPPINLTSNPADDFHPDWSPDGTKLAFTSDRDGHSEVYVMDPDGGAQTQLTDHPADDSAPDWSPDGSQILFQTDRDGNSEIYVMNADGSSQTNLTNNAADDHHPAWSPSGTQILFFSDRDGNDEVYVMDSDGSNPVNLSNNAANDGLTAWSHDGLQIAFATDRDGNFELYTMDADGSNPVRVTNDGENDLFPVWSPDDAQLAFRSDRRASNIEVFISNADGSAAFNRTIHPAVDCHPDWTDAAAAAAVVPAWRRAAPAPARPAPRVDAARRATGGQCR